ncbi:hypothetical protein [Enterococcus dispar]|uniref:hypothetical protein n=1 Tax=Enterococcus dispar TaxID=44009 RepID=UPI00039B84CE|nr:hypothetical protein [Enterococcus dispar]OJG38121.1 hypothetical protein RV01_GL000481 [Enterococcus dispar]
MIDYVLSIDTQPRQCYKVYQELLTAFDAKNPTEFFNLMEKFPIQTGNWKARTTLAK